MKFKLPLKHEIKAYVGVIRGAIPDHCDQCVRVTAKKLAAHPIKTLWDWWHSYRVDWEYVGAETFPTNGETWMLRVYRCPRCGHTERVK